MRFLVPVLYFECSDIVIHPSSTLSLKQVVYDEHELTPPIIDNENTDNVKQFIRTAYQILASTSYLTVIHPGTGGGDKQLTSFWMHSTEAYSAHTERWDASRLACVYASGERTHLSSTDISEQLHSFHIPMYALFYTHKDKLFHARSIPLQYTSNCTVEKTTTGALIPKCLRFIKDATLNAFARSSRVVFVRDGLVFAHYRPMDIDPVQNDDEDIPHKRRRIWPPELRT